MKVRNARNNVFQYWYLCLYCAFQTSYMFNNYTGKGYNMFVCYFHGCTLITMNLICCSFLVTAYKLSIIENDNVICKFCRTFRMLPTDCRLQTQETLPSYSLVHIKSIFKTLLACVVCSSPLHHFILLHSTSNKRFWQRLSLWRYYSVKLYTNSFSNLTSNSITLQILI